MWQEDLSEVYLRQVEAQGGPKVFSKAVEESRHTTIKSSKEAVELLKQDPWGIFFGFEEPVMRELGNDHCLFTKVPGLGMPFANLDFPFVKGLKSNIFLN